MKGIQGLIIAIVLGLIGAVVNLVYLHNQGKLDDGVSFIILREGKSVKQGETFHKQDLTTFSIQKKYSGNLEKIAFPQGEETSIAGFQPTRDYVGNELILRQDLNTAPSPETHAPKGKFWFWAPIDNRQIVSSLITPRRTRVSFLMPPVIGGGPGSVLAPPGGDADQVGPFDVVSVGTRMGTLGTAKAERIPQSQENVLTLEAPEGDKKAKRLVDYIRQTNGRPLVVVLPGAS